jgi:hypothetical protein
MEAESWLMKSLKGQRPGDAATKQKRPPGGRFIRSIAFAATC